MRDSIEINENVVATIDLTSVFVTKSDREHHCYNHVNISDSNGHIFVLEQM